ncbi:unnamed protein product [Rotaria socialis]|uniref:NHL repeat containing protein n=1 Tax=Rotaria socialis TaxID=392032 RepID=A0A821D4R2_9BILA|nr:unnamed protein product [Rotaria socialis]
MSNNLGIFLTNKDRSSTTVKMTDYQIISNQSITNDNWTRADRHFDMRDRATFIREHHRYLKRKKNERYCGGYCCFVCCSPLGIIIAIFTAILVAAAIAAMLLALVTSQKIVITTTSMTTTTTTMTTTTTTTATTTMPCISVGINGLNIPICATWNQTGITVAGNQNTAAGSNLASLAYPIDIFVDNNYTLFVADGNNNRIVMYYENAASGILVAGTSTGSGSSQLNQPKGISVDQTGAVVVGDTSNYRIQKFPYGSMVATTVTANSGSSPLGITRDLHTDCNDDIYVTDSDNNRVVMFYQSSSIGVVVAGNNGAGSAANQFSTPYGSFIDQNGTLYVADYGNHRVQMWPAGATSGITVAGITGSYGSSLMHLNYPDAVIVDNNGYIYIADSVNNRIMKWTTNYTIGGVCVVGCTTIAGSSPTHLNSPRDIRFDPSGNIYVSDQGNNRIQKFMIELPASSCPISG